MNDATSKAGPADLVEIYYSPSEVFDRRRDGKFGLPLAVFVVVSMLLFFVTQDLVRPIMDAEWRTAAEGIREKNPQVTPEQLEMMRTMGRRFALPFIALYSLVGPLLAGLVLWIVSKFVGVRPSLTVATMIAVFAFFPMLVEYIVGAVQMLLVSEDSITSRYSLSMGPARFMDDASRPMKALFGHIDVFTIWMAALMGIGLKTVAGATTRQAAIVAVVMWLLGLLFPLLGAMN